MSDHAESRAALARGDLDAAFLSLRPALTAPELVVDTRRFVAAFELFAQIARGIAGDGLADVLRRAARSPDDVRALYDAGYQLYEARLFDVGASALQRAHRLAPGDPGIVTELVACLEEEMRYGQGFAALEAFVGRDAVCTYLSGFCALMTGRTDVAASRVKTLGSPADATVKNMRDQLAAMVARAEVLARSAPLGLSGWHLAINGTFLLHESPHGFDQGMNGRCAFVSDSPGLMREGIDRLLALLDARVPSRVVFAPDRASKILGVAVAKAASRPVIAWTEALGSPEDALVVAWDLESVGDGAFLRALGEHAPGQVLFAHASAWVEPFPYAPDVTTFLHQVVTNPWTGGALVLGPDRTTAKAEPDTRSDAALADEVLAGATTDASVTSKASVLALRDAVRALPPESTAGLFRASGARAKQRKGSPVPSSYFR